MKKKIRIIIDISMTVMMPLLDKLLEMQEVIDKNGFVEGTIHRYLIVAKKKG